MATVTALADRVCQHTGLQTTSTERALVIEALNDAYRTGVRLTGCNETSASYTFVSATDDYSLASTIALTDVLRINSITYTYSGTTYPLHSKSQDEVNALRQANTVAGDTRIYSIMGLDKLMLYPQPAVGASITIRYFQRPPTLVESGPGAGEESTPSKIPVEFHWSVICAGAVVTSLLKDQRIDDAAEWDRMYQQGIAGLKAHVEQFTPPAPVYLDGGGSLVGDNDLIRRG